MIELVQRIVDTDPRINAFLFAANHFHLCVCEQEVVFELDVNAQIGQQRFTGTVRK